MRQRERVDTVMSSRRQRTSWCTGAGWPWIGQLINRSRKETDRDRDTSLAHVKSILSHLLNLERPPASHRTHRLIPHIPVAAAVIPLPSPRSPRPAFPQPACILSAPVPETAIKVPTSSAPVRHGWAWERGRALSGHQEASRNWQSQSLDRLHSCAKSGTPCQMLMKCLNGKLKCW